MRFDINDTGKYIFDQRQELTVEELGRLEEEYRARLQANHSPAYKNMSFTNAADTANLIVTYIIIGLAIGLPLLSWFVLFTDLTGYFRVFAAAGVTLAGIGAMLIVKLILRATVRQRVYSAAVDAECIGYARYLEASGSDTGAGLISYDQMYVSPVLKYRYEGTAYTGCYDGFDLSKDSPVALGPVRIEISPGHPESVYNPGAQQKDLLVLFAVVFVVAGVGLTIAGLM